MPDQPDDLETRLAAARLRNAPLVADTGAQPDAAMGMGARSGIEFVAAIVVSALIGYGIDRWLGTKPFGMLILLAIGFAAGLLNVYRAMNGMTYAQTYAKPTAPIVDETEEDL